MTLKTDPTSTNDPLTLANSVPVSSLTAVASTNVDISMEPTMQQLLLQVQAQQAHLQQIQAHSDAQEHVRAHLAAATTAMNIGNVASPHINLHTGNEAIPMELLQPAAINSPPIPPVTETSTTVHRKSIPLSMKKEAIEWIMGPGKGIPSRAEKHFSALQWDVSASSFRKWWKNRDRIMNDSSSKKRISGGGRKPYLEDTEEKVLVMVIQERAKKDRVTRKWIASTAQHMFQRNNAAFKASENWVTKFIRRNGLTLKRSYVTYEHEEGNEGMIHGQEDQLEMDQKPRVQVVEEGLENNDEKNIMTNTSGVVV